MHLELLGEGAGKTGQREPGISASAGKLRAMMEVSAGRPRYEKVLERMANACEKSGRKIDDVRLVAVSKIPSCRGCLNAWLPMDRLTSVKTMSRKPCRNENELDLPDLRWHMIGHVQSRKAPVVAGKFVLLHTLDSIKLCQCPGKTLNSKNIRRRQR